MDREWQQKWEMLLDAMRRGAARQAVLECIDEVQKIIASEDHGDGYALKRRLLDWCQQRNARVGESLEIDRAWTASEEQ